MNLIERYALSCGLKIGEPYIYEKYFPLPSDWGKYVTFHPHSKPAKNYDFWQDVLDDVAPVLDAHGYKVVQLGAKDDPKYQKCVNLNGMTSISQSAYVMKRSSLHMSTDTFTAHMAGAFNVPLVSLYSSCYIQNSQPYWGDKKKQSLLEPNRKNGQKPFFAFDENPKTINTIKTEDISNNIFKQLGLKERAGYETVYVGKKYTNGAFFHNIVPSEPQFAVNRSDVEIRMDLFFNEEFLAKQLQVSKCAIITDRPIDINLLKQFKPNVSILFYDVKNELGKDFCKQVVALGIPVMFISSLPQEQVNGLKMHYYEQGKIDKIPTVPEEDRDGALAGGGANLKYKSNKMYTNRDKSFYSTPDMEAEATCSPPSYRGFPLEAPEVWDDFEFLKIIKELD
jgi:hypothetical protein